jgi:hypothetical protein
MTGLEYPPILPKVAGSISAQYKHLCAWICLFLLNLGISLVYYYLQQQKLYKYVFIRYLESIKQSL